MCCVISGASKGAIRWRDGTTSTFILSAPQRWYRRARAGCPRRRRPVRRIRLGCRESVPWCSRGEQATPFGGSRERRAGREHASIRPRSIVRWLVTEAGSTRPSRIEFARAGPDRTGSWYRTGSW